MQVKCTSCRAYQSLSDKCEYCGVKLNINNENKEVSNEDLKSFKLAFFEFNNKNYSRSSLLFDEIIKNDSELFVAWVYKVMSDFLNTFTFSVDFDILLKNIKFLVENSKNESNLRFLEEKLIFLIEKIYLDEYTDRTRDIHFEQYIRLRGAYTDNFFEFLNYLSQLFSIDFSQKLIKILVNYFEYHKSHVYGYIGTGREINADGVNLMKDLLYKDPETSHQLFKAILEANVGIFERRIIDIAPIGLDKNTIDSNLQYCKELANAFFKITNIDQDRVFNDFELKVKSLPVVKENNSTEKKDGCFIATAAMQDYDHPVVVDLRLFRDNWLLKRKWGANFTIWYYQHSPKAARVIEQSSVLRRLTFFLIVKPLQIITKPLK